MTSAFSHQQPMTHKPDLPLSRRTLLAASAAACLAAPAVAEDGFDDMPYIDAHSHVWPPEVDKFPLAKGQTKADLKPPSFTDVELLKLANAEKVGRVALIQHHTYHGWDNSYLIDCARRNPGKFVVVGMVDDAAPHPDVKMRELLPQRVRSFRITPWIHKDKWLDSPGMALMWKTAAETGQSMGCLIDAKDLPAVDAMCAKFPQTPVVIDHFALIGVDGMIRDSDVAALCKLARHKRTHVKLSAYYALGKKKPPYDDLAPMIRKVLDAFGQDRCMWASDSPYQVQGEHTYAASIALIRDRLDFLSAGDKDWLLRKTAEKVYFTA
jgi:predicted TIM-barrel fold metal-dependent hydrolase